LPSPIYLDWNATTPPHPDVVAAMGEAARSAWANPASLHRAGRAAQAVVEQAREAVAALVGLAARDVTFTSGGTEANNLALFRPFIGGTGTLITSRLEHPSVTGPAELLEARGVTLHWLPVPSTGRLNPEDIERALEAPGAAPKLIAVQAVNHETGVIQTIGDIAGIAHRHGAELHVDAVQAVGKLPAESWLGADSVSVAAHKIRGAKGIGALAVRPGVSLRPILRGGAQERGHRPGTLSPSLAAGFGAAARRATSGPERYQRLASLRQRLEEQLTAIGKKLGVPPLRNGGNPRAPHVSNFSWPGWAGDELAAALDVEGVCVSSGSACAAGTAEPSRVIAAMLGEERAKSAVRVSLGDETGEEDLNRAITVFEHVLARHRSSA
jgi:cysteine desulfurase